MQSLTDVPVQICQGLIAPFEAPPTSIGILASPRVHVQMFPASKNPKQQIDKNAPYLKACFAAIPMMIKFQCSSFLQIKKKGKKVVTEHALRSWCS